MNIDILGAHANESKTTRCISFLIDNSLAIDAGALTSSLTLIAQENIKSILLTHSHFDHIKDIPLFALNCFRMNKRIHIYALPSVISNIKKHLLNGHVYPEFFALPVKKPTVNFHRIVPFQERQIGKYQVLAIPVNHRGDTVGYQIQNSEGKSLFYTSDTGPGLSKIWGHLSCQLLIIETTLPNAQEEYARQTGHLTPDLLVEELKSLKKTKGDLPEIVVVHNDPLLETKIRKELATIARNQKIHVTVATEGMQLII